MTPSEQEYLKHIYLFAKKWDEKITTNHLALLVNTKASSVTDMIKKLSTKELIVYNRYYGCKLTGKGKKLASEIFRRNCLWEIMLIQKLGIPRDEGIILAKQFQSIESDMLIERLSAFLDNPQHDINGVLIK